MKIRLLTLTSLFALMAVSPAIAQMDTTSPSKTLQDSADSAGETVQSGMDTATNKVKGVFEGVKGALIDTSENPSISPVVIDMRMTARGILDKSVLSTNGDSLGTVEDIIMNQDGKAEMVVISKGGFMGVGDKMAAFDYDLIMRREADGDVVMPLSKETIDTARQFSYNRADASAKIRVMGTESLSVKDLLKGSLADYTNKVVAKNDNIFFDEGRAKRVIFTFDQTAGLGGEKAIMDFSSLKLAHVSNDWQFQMTERQSMQFENYRKTTTN